MSGRSGVRRSTPVATVLVSLLSVPMTPISPARANVAPDRCVGAYESAQERRSEGRLVAARALLLTCAQDSCPGFISQDCRRWLDEVEIALPTVVFAVRQDGREVERVRVSRNGQEIATRVDGRAIPVDPGKHAFRFETAGGWHRNVEVLVVEGEKSRVIPVELPASRAPAADLQERAAPASPAPSMGRRVAPWMAALGAAGLGGFAGFALAGRRQESELEGSCAPACDPAEARSIRRKYAAADVSLGIGVGALAAAGYLYLRSARQAAASGPASAGVSASSPPSSWGMSFLPRAALFTHVRSF